MAQRTLVAQHRPLLQTQEVVDVGARNLGVIQPLDGFETNGTRGTLVQQLVYLEYVGLESGVLSLQVVLVVAGQSEDQLGHLVLQLDSYLVVHQGLLQTRDLERVGVPEVVQQGEELVVLLLVPGEQVTVQQVEEMAHGITAHHSVVQTSHVYVLALLLLYHPLHLLLNSPDLLSLATLSLVSVELVHQGGVFLGVYGVECLETLLVLGVVAP